MKKDQKYLENNNVLFHRAVINLQNYELSGSTLQAQITEKVIILECKILNGTAKHFTRIKYFSKSQ